MSGYHRILCIAMCERDPTCYSVNFYGGIPFQCELGNEVVMWTDNRYNQTESNDSWQVLARKIIYTED